MMDWSQLTRHPDKARLYRDEPVCIEFGSHLDGAVGGTIDRLRDLTLLILKPEALRRHASGRVLDFLASHGYVPLASRQVWFHATTSHLLWRYQWTKATPDRMRLHCRMGRDAPSLLILLRSSSTVAVPASVRLWGLKGSTDGSRRSPDALRTVVGMSNRMIAFVHCPDEPADVVRDLGILWPSSDRAALFDAINSSRTGLSACGSVCAGAEALERQVARHTVDSTEVVGRHRRCPGGCGRIAVAVDQGEIWSLSDVEAGFGAPVDDRQRWDLFTLAAELIRHDAPGRTAVIAPESYQEVRAAWAS